MSPTVAPAPPKIDPRIRARRIEVQRDLGRRRLRRVVAIGALGALAAGGWGLTQSPLLDVDHVRVAGTTHTAPSLVVEASGIRRGDPLVTADLNGAASAIAELPWVQTVEVSRRWPGTVRISVVERVPQAAVPVVGGEAWLLLDAEGRQLGVVSDVSAEIVRLGTAPVDPEPGASFEGAGAALEMAASAPAAARAHLIELRDEGEGEVVGLVRLPDGGEATLHLGGTDRLEAKWLALLSLLASIDPAGLTDIDVRVPSAPALTRG